MTERFLLYGATGFTGKLILDRALAAGMRPTLVGRDPARLRALADPAGLPWRAAGLDAPGPLAAACRGASVVLNAAGPFADTALRVAEAATVAGAHYLDVTGEVDVIEALAERHATWRERKAMVMPAVGFDVVPSDCLAVHVARRLPGATRLRIGVSGLRLLSRGSAETLAREWGRATRVRRGGALCAVPPGSRQHAFDFGEGPVPCLLVSWGDVASASYSTGIPDVETYFVASLALRGALAANRLVGGLLAGPAARDAISTWHRLLPDGPSAAERATVTTAVVAEAERADGTRVAARVRAGDSYEFTAASAVALVARVLAGEAIAGFQTPGRVFGPELLAGLGYEIEGCGI
jgi:short subunit dehydrogenase-like uncharacterized protein